MPTRNKQAVHNALNALEGHDIGGTDLGTAVLNGIQVLLPIRGEKHMIIISDGRMTLGTSLASALEQAAAADISIDSVLIKGAREREVDYTHEALMLIGNMTGGQTHAVTIDQDIPPEVINPEHDGEAYVPLFDYLLITALMLLTLEWILSKSIYKTVPHD